MCVCVCVCVCVVCVVCTYIEGSATHYIDFKSYPLYWLCDHNYAHLYSFSYVANLINFISILRLNVGPGL